MFKLNNFFFFLVNLGFQRQTQLNILNRIKKIINITMEKKFKNIIYLYKMTI